MKKFFLTLLMPLVAFTGCAADDPSTQPADQDPDNSESTAGNETKTLIVYFSAEGHTKAVAEAIKAETGGDIFFIEPAEPYAANPYADSDKIQKEAYDDLRPAVKNYLPAERMAAYDTVFVGTPCWWHQPAMVVCTFLEHYDLSGKTVIPFVTFGARTYLNETMQKLYKCTPNSLHIPASLPEDIDPGNIRQPQNDDDGIDMPSAAGVGQWLSRIGYGKKDAE